MPLDPLPGILYLFFWIAIAWAAGAMTVLGSLMILGSLLLLLIPTTVTKSKKSESPSPAISPAWQGRLKLLGVSIALTLLGLVVLVIVPFPQL